MGMFSIAVAASSLGLDMSAKTTCSTSRCHSHAGQMITTLAQKDGKAETEG